MEDDPVRWKEYHIEGLAVLPLLRRVPRLMGVAIVCALSTVGSTLTLSASTSRPYPGSPDPAPFIGQAFLFLFVAALVVTVRSAGAVTGEREGRTWDSLRLTPLDGRTFLNGKLRGIIDAVGPYYFAYAAPAFLVSVPGGIAAIVATVVSLLMAWPVMYYAAACGLRASVFGRSTWRSLAVALLAVYVTGILVCFGISLAGGIVGACLAAVFLAGPAGRGVGEAVALIFLFLILIGCALALVALAKAQVRQAAARVFNVPPE